MQQDSVDEKGWGCPGPQCRCGRYVLFDPLASAIGFEAGLEGRRIQSNLFRVLQQICGEKRTLIGKQEIVVVPEARLSFGANCGFRGRQSVFVKIQGEVPVDEAELSREELVEFT